MSELGSGIFDSAMLCNCLEQYCTTQTLPFVWSHHSAHYVQRRLWSCHTTDFCPKIALQLIICNTVILPTPLQNTVLLHVNSIDNFEPPLQKKKTKQITNYSIWNLKLLIFQYNWFLKIISSLILFYVTCYICICHASLFNSWNNNDNNNSVVDNPQYVCIQLSNVHDTHL